MADQALSAESALANTADAIDIAYHAYRHARAAWDLVLYAPEHVTDDAPEEIETPLSRAHFDALKGFMLAPCTRPSHLARKLKVFRDEEIQDGINCADEIVDMLARDAEKLVREWA